MARHKEHFDQVVLSCRIDRDLYNRLLHIAGERQQQEKKSVTVSGLVRIALESFAGEANND